MSGKSGSSCGDHRRYWLAPIIVVLLLVGLLLIVAKSSVIAPFIYTLF